MRLALAILNKDARRFWWEIAVTLGVLVVLTRMDCNRQDFVAGPTEGLLNLLLPAAWSYLVAVVIQEEPPVGDRQFWLTRPYPRSSLVAAKALFALVFIHVPWLVADAVILWVHGFQPLQYSLQLLWKQILLAAAVTLPAAALATVTSNLAQFVLAAVAISGAAALLVGMVEPFHAPWIQVDAVRRELALSVLAAAAMTIFFLQYVRRRTLVSRSVGIAAILTAGAVYVYIPRHVTFLAQCLLSRAATDRRPLSIRFDPRKELPRRARFPSSVQRLVIPIVVSGMPDGAGVRFDQLAFAIVGPRGERWKMPLRKTQPGSDIVAGGLSIQDQNAGWQNVIVSRFLYDRIKGERVIVDGKVAATTYREGEVARMPVEAGMRTVPILGRCSSGFVQGSAGELIKVVCESPSEIPLGTQVRLVTPESAKPWKQVLGDSMPSVPYPWQTWLSPLNRRQTFFHVIEERRTDGESSWLVPRPALANANVEFVPQQVMGCAVLDYQFEDVALRDFAVQ